MSSFNSFLIRKFFQINIALFCSKSKIIYNYLKTFIFIYIHRNKKYFFFFFNLNVYKYLSFLFLFMKKSVGSEIRTLVTTATTLDPDH